MSQSHVSSITLADHEWPDCANPFFNRGGELGWARLRGPPAAHDQIPLAVARLGVMAHVPVTAHGPKAGDGQFRVIQSYADGTPCIRVRRMVRERQRAPIDESTQCRAEAVREVKAELLCWVVAMRKER